MILITVVVCNKDYGLFGIDLLKVDIIKLINSIKPEENNIGLLRRYKASIHLKENHHPSYVEFKKLLIDILLIVMAKF